MATLVFSTVGTMLGGPVGGAIGALLGQSLDEQILGPSQRGPKVGDLSVQTSTYGTQIPRIYGTMRVAGSVVWSTDLVQSDQTSGAKGQTGATTSYKVSCAVALSARPATTVTRIWADGKLLRGADGDFKVPVTFRFYDGSEDQIVDPLIASVEGIGTTPAYRGIALAVFEDFELAEFGNRIPFLTFEVVGEAEAPTIGAILHDLSAGAIALDAERTVAGYAAYGRSIRAAAEPLVSMYDLAAFDDGDVVRSPSAPTSIAIAAEELGQSADDKPPIRTRREQMPARSLPARSRLRFYDPERDYQSGEARASIGDQAGIEAEQELAAVLSAGEAKALAQQIIAKAWLGADQVTVSLPPAMLGIEPGNVVDLPLIPSRWRIDKVGIEGFVAVVEARPVVAPMPATLDADAGQAVIAADLAVGDITLALLDVPGLSSRSEDSPTIYLAASSDGGAWRSQTVTVTSAGQSLIVPTARRKTVMGLTETALDAGTCILVDRINHVDIVLHDRDQWLTSCDDGALAAGANLAMIGRELLQFSGVEPLGGGRFRLSGLMRGRGGTEEEASSHVAGEDFVLIDPGAMTAIDRPAWAIGGDVDASIAGTDVATSLVMSSASIRPMSPIRMLAANDGAGGLGIRWVRRSRAGFAWIDEVDAPLGERVEAYRVTLAGAAGTIEQSVATSTTSFSAADLASLGAAPWTLAVRQVGDHAVSPPTTLVITSL